MLSTNTNAPVPPPNVDIPRIQNSEIFFPGCPDCIMANTPGTFPANAFDKLDVGFDFMSSTSTVLTAPVSVNLDCGPVPVTTTSSSTLISDSWSVTSIRSEEHTSELQSRE